MGICSLYVADNHIDVTSLLAVQGRNDGFQTDLPMPYPNSLDVEILQTRACEVSVYCPFDTESLGVGEEMWTLVYE